MVDACVVSSTATTANTAAAGNSGKSGVQSAPTHTITAKDRKMIQSIKELVGNGFSDTDIYLVLKEFNMDLDECANKLLNQDPFHEVKRRNRKKEPQIHIQNHTEGLRKTSEIIRKSSIARNFIHRNIKRGDNYGRTPVRRGGGTNREFRVVRDNRVNQGVTKDFKSSAVSFSGSVHGNFSGREMGLFEGSEALKHKPEHVGTEAKPMTEDKRNVQSNVFRVSTPKHSGSQQPTMITSSNSVVGVYSSSTDPVHVPSPESRSSAAVGAIKREVGVVGGRRLSSDGTVKEPSASANSVPSSVTGKDRSFSDSFRPFSTPKFDSNGQNGPAESVTTSNRPFSGHQNGKLHHSFGHPKAAQQNKEWKPKLSQKPDAVTATKSIPASDDNPNEAKIADTDLQDKISQTGIYENQNVIIAQHIRVTEPDKLRLTFGSFGVEVDHTMKFLSGFQSNGNPDEIIDDSRPSSSLSVPEASSDDGSSEKQDGQGRVSESSSPTKSENQLPDESSSPNMDSYTDIGLDQENPPSYDSEAQQQPEPSELPSFPAYDPQSGYELSYFRPPMDRTSQGQGLPSHEVFNNLAANTISASQISVVQQQQQPTMAQMYPQVHLSHYTNLMPYRQFLSPVYVPQMAIPGYSSNAAYPHPNSNGYLLMPGANSHLKYGIQQFKPVPGGSPTAYGNFSNPTGYTISPPGVVNNGAALDDSSRMKFKDGSLYVPTPQAEASGEMWVQNTREIPGVQSPAYYNIPAQTPHAPYVASHTGHASFNAAAPQSSHMQFSGLYPPQPSPIATPHHHLGQVISGGAAAAQVPAYQQPQMGHLNWTTNF